MAEEIELKFIIEDYKETAKKLNDTCKFLSAAYELTVMYDNKGKDLFRDDARLRLRQIKDLKSNQNKCEFSYKKPKTREGIKIEEENEVSVSSFEEMEEILKKMGFIPVSSYDRIRDTFVKEDCKITLDTFSFGNLLEIEGEIEKIKKVAKDLGLNLRENTSKSCDDIYVDICKKEGREAGEHILFNKKLLSVAISQRDFLLK